MSIKDKITDDMKAAMRAHEKERLLTIRLILSAIKQREIDDRIVLSDDQIQAILNKLIKQRRDSITQFEAGNRPDLASKEAAEILVIQTYLPEQLSEVEIEQAITTAIQETSAFSAKDMGKVMGLLKASLHGRADMTVVSSKVKERLAS
ncbi:MAG: GatB/YqeY domain-containing protein [Gammaproteobacteria bacterium]|nr:GatB/YqeY domain-containing protein [Gammaproteobacteria bacterium]